MREKNEHLCYFFLVLFVLAVYGGIALAVILVIQSVHMSMAARRMDNLYSPQDIRFVSTTRLKLLQILLAVAVIYASVFMGITYGYDNSVSAGFIIGIFFFIIVGVPASIVFLVSLKMKKRYTACESHYRSRLLKVESGES